MIYFLFFCWRTRANACNCTNSRVRNWSITIRRSFKEIFVNKKKTNCWRDHTCDIELLASSDNESILSVITILPKKYLCSLGKSFDKIIERLSLKAVVVGLDFYLNEKNKILKREFSSFFFYYLIK